MRLWVSNSVVYTQSKMELNQPVTRDRSKLLVVKAGGAQGVDLKAISQDAGDLISAGYHLVLVHGGSAEANELGEALDYPPRFITSPSGHTSRYTDQRTLEIFAMAVNGKINTFMVETLQRLGVNAIGLSGLDGRLLLAKRKTAIQSIEGGKRKIIRDDFSGKIEQVNVSLLESLLVAGYTPVVSPIAISMEAEALNVDADRAAAAIAGSLGVGTLILLTSAIGLLSAYPDESTLIANLPKSRLEEAEQFAQGRMKKKVLGAEEALNAGVTQVIIADGRVEKPITRALAGHGTIIS